MDFGDPEMITINAADEHPTHHDEDDRSRPRAGDGASPGKIFIGGLARETTTEQFVKYFEKYGDITDSVIMKDRNTGQPRGFGFITYADAAVVDRVIEENHIINGKQVEIKRTIPKGAIGARDFKTKKIFVGGIPASVDEDEFKEFFSKFGGIREHQIMRDHSTNRSRGFGFVTFDADEVVDKLLSKGNRIDFAGTKVEIKKAEPKKPNAPPSSRRHSDSRGGYGGGGFEDSYGSYGEGGYGAASYRAGGAYGGRPSAAAYGGFGGGEFAGYGGYSGGAMGGYRADPSSYAGGYGGYSGRYGGGLSRGYDMGGAGGGGYGGPSESYGGGYGASGGSGGYSGAGGYGSSSAVGGDSAYESSMGGGYGGSGVGPMYGASRGGYGGGASARYNPYSR